MLSVEEPSLFISERPPDVDPIVIDVTVLLVVVDALNTVQEPSDYWWLVWL